MITTALWVLLGSPSFAGDTTLKAEFKVDEKAMPMQSAVASMDPRDRVVIDFYAFPLTDEEMALVQKGDTKPITDQQAKLTDEQKTAGLAKLTLTLDADRKAIWKAELMTPELQATVAEYTLDPPDFAETFVFDGKKVQITSKGSHKTNMGQTLAWDFTVEGPVIPFE